MDLRKLLTRNVCWRRHRSGRSRRLLQDFADERLPLVLLATCATVITSWAKITPPAVTMTGELADCFATKAEGVARILAAVQAAAETRRVSVWSTAGRFVTPDSPPMSITSSPGW